MTGDAGYGLACGALGFLVASLFWLNVAGLGWATLPDAWRKLRSLRKGRP